jgi:hypothetical protein
MAFKNKIYPVALRLLGQLFFFASVSLEGVFVLLLDGAPI